MNYIVVQVDQDYDYLAGVRYIKSFATESLAQKFIEDKLEEQNVQYKAKCEYIEKYVDSIDTPEEANYNEWKEFLKQYNFHVCWWTPNEFKKEFKIYLKNNHPVNIAGYDPPIVSNKYNNLFIVDISKTDEL